MKTNVRKKKKQPAALSHTARKRLVSESRALGLTQREYLELITQLAATLRQNVWPKPIKNSEILRTIVENPALLQMMVSLAGTLYRSTRDDEETKIEATSDKPDAGTSTERDATAERAHSLNTVRSAAPAPSPSPERARYVRDPLTGRPIAIHAPTHSPQ